MMEKENKAAFKNNAAFEITCKVEETDYLQSDLMGSYGDMLYNRNKVKKKTVIGVCICIAASVAILAIDSVVNQYIIFSAGFGLLYLLYGIYYCAKGYKNEFVQMQKFLSESMDKGRTIYGDCTYTYEFGEDRVDFTDSNGVRRYFMYEDIRYFEETANFYEIGMKYNPRLKRLAGLEKVLITKRYLDDEMQKKYLSFKDNVSSAYNLKPVLEDNPFK